ncbi:hypothetical protein PTKIN_Ptkin16aG0006300 [Pterospermum kingtungense]
MEMSLEAPHSSSDQKLQYYPPQKLNGKVIVAPPREVFEKGMNQWKESLVVQFIAGVPNFSLFKKLAKQLWGSDGEFEILPIDNDLFIVKFSNPAARDRVLESGPWHIRNRPLIVRKWEPGIKPLEFDLSTMPVWFHLRNVPLELFTQKGLSCIASVLGTPLFMDRITANQERLEYAKVCVEIDVLKEIPSHIDVKMRNGSRVSVTVEVPWMPPKCIRCSIFGHNEKTCARKPVVAATEEAMQPGDSVAKANLDEGSDSEKPDIEVGGLLNASKLGKAQITKVGRVLEKSSCLKSVSGNLFEILNSAVEKENGDVFINDDNGSESSKELCQRNWLELPRDLTVSILSRLGAIQIIESAQKVCMQCRNICKDPSMWRSIDMRNLDDLSSMPYDLEKMCMHAIDRSCGGLVDINIEYFGTDELLAYIAHRTNNLRRLRLVMCWDVSDEGLIEAASEFPLLEELEIYFGDTGKDSIEAFGSCCPLLRTFKYNQEGTRDPSYQSDEEALAIAENMHGLHHLQLIGNKLTNRGLQAILDGCPYLESLDLRKCFHVNLKGDIGKRCAEQIKNLRRPDDSIHDYPFTAEMNDSGFSSYGYDSDDYNDCDDYGDYYDYGYFDV